MIQEDKSATLGCSNDQTLFVPCAWDVVAFEGNGARPSHKGSGFSVDNVSFTLNATEQHGVAYSADDAKVYDARGNGDGEIANTITGDHNGHINDYTTICKQGYIVRRLTPTECARLQGFPDWWCADLDTEEPTEEDVAFWRDVFETHRRIVTQSSKPKSDAQIIKWLEHPHSDSAEYKMWGNGVALPCVYYIMQGIASIMNEEV